MSNSHVLLLLNPVAGHRAALFALTPIVKALSAQGCDTTVHLTTHAGDAADYARLYAGSYSRVLCCGGDGTLSEVIRGLISGGHDVPVGYIPCGTTNDLAHALHLPTELSAAIKTAVTGSAHAHDIGILNDQVYFDYVAAFGAFTDTSFATRQELKNALGRAAYLMQGAKDLFTLKPLHLQLSTGNMCIDGEFYYGSISNSTRIGGIIDLTDKGVQFDDGMLEILLIRQAPTVQAILDFREQRYDPNYFYLLHAAEATFRFEQPVNWSCDGESAGPFTEVTFRILPRAVNLLY